MELAIVDDETMEFCYECLFELRGDVKYGLQDFEKYVQTNLNASLASKLYVGFDQNKPVGILTVNQFQIPRYLGYGYELEEVVVQPDYQMRGYGKKLVEAFLERVEDEPDLRKVIVKTDDDERAGRLYKHFFEVVDTTTYSRTINYL